MTYTFNYESSAHNVKEFHESEYGKVRGFRLLTIVGKQLWYNINASNDTITWNEDTATTLTATIAQGNYTYLTIATALMTAMDASSVAGGGSLTYTVSLDATTFLSTISVGVGHTVQITPTSGDLGYLLGFHANSADAVSVTSDSCYDLTDNYLEVRFSNPSINSRHYIEDTYYDGLVSWQIPITGLSGTLIYFQDTEDGPYRYKQRDWFKFAGTKIEIYNPNGQLLDNRGGNITIVIKLIR